MLDSRYLRPSTLESSAPRQFQRQRPKLLPAACRLALSLPLVNSLGRGSKNMTCICGMRRIPVFVYPAECGAITDYTSATARRAACNAAWDTRARENLTRHTETHFSPV